MRRWLLLLIFLIRCSETGLEKDYRDVNGIYLKKIGEYYGFNDARDIAGKDGYLYVADGEGIVILNAKNPLKPTVVDTLNPMRSYTTIRVRGDYLYAISYSYPRLEVFDISNPSNPIEIGGCEAWGENFVIRGRYLYMIGGGLRVVNIGNPLEPTQVGWEGIEGSDITVEGNYAYVLEGSGGWSKLHIIDISNPSSPQSCLTYSALKDELLWFYAIESKGSYLMGIAPAYKADGVELLDITDPWDIKYLDFCGLPPEICENPKTFLVDSLFIYTLGVHSKGSGYGLFLLSFSPDSTELAVSEIYEEPESSLGVLRSLSVEGSRIYILGSKGLEIIEMEPIEE